MEYHVPTHPLPSCLLTLFQTHTQTHKQTLTHTRTHTHTHTHIHTHTLNSSRHRLLLSGIKVFRDVNNILSTPTRDQRKRRKKCESAAAVAAAALTTEGTTTTTTTAIATTLLPPLGPEMMSSQMRWLWWQWRRW